MAVFRAIKAPKSVIIWDALPQGNVGKVLKKDMRPRSGQIATARSDIRALAIVGARSLFSDSIGDERSAAALAQVAA
jgi:hypothetical protein